MVLGPDLGAVSGVSTHVRLLLDSVVGTELSLVHVQTGSEGRGPEGAARKLWRLATGPIGLAWVLLRTAAPLVHVNSAMEHKAYWRDLTFVAVSRALGRRVVLQIHGGHLPADFARAVPGGSAVLRRTLGWCDELVVLAQVERAAYLAFDAGPGVTVVPNAIEDDAASRASTCRLPDRRRLELVYVGRLTREKGIFEAADATAAARARGLDVRMTYAGAGPDEADLRRAVAQLGLDDVVRFTGPVFGRAKTDLWRQSDVFCFATDHREGLPYALLEAMATRTLVVTSRAGGIPDVVDQTQALLVEPRSAAAVVDALVWVDEHRDEAARMVRAARARVEEAYLVDRLAADFLGLYRAVLAPGEHR